jgi:hypothetical protein
MGTSSQPTTDLALSRKRDHVAGQPVELVIFTVSSSATRASITRDDPSGQSQDDGPRGQTPCLGPPRAGVLQQMRAFRARPGKGRVRDQRAALLAFHSRRPRAGGAGQSVLDRLPPMPI